MHPQREPLICLEAKKRFAKVSVACDHEKKPQMKLCVKMRYKQGIIKKTSFKVVNANFS